MARWGLPDWRIVEGYPVSLTDRIWRWEFLRRRPAYREAWLNWQNSVETEGGIVAAVTDNHEAVIGQFGVPVLYDPSVQFDDWVLMQLFRPASGFIVRYDPKRRDDMRFADYQFDLTRPLEPQMTKARRHLEHLQKEIHGKQNTPKPRRNNWCLFLRALDARDCRATFSEMTKTFGPVRPRLSSLPATSIPRPSGCEKTSPHNSQRPERCAFRTKASPFDLKGGGALA